MDEHEAMTSVLDLQTFEPPTEDRPGTLGHGGDSILSVLCVSPG